MPSDVNRRLRIAYVYRDFTVAGSIGSFYLRRAERLAEDEDVVAVCSASRRDKTDAPLRFETVEPLLRSRGRFGYAIECASFALRAEVTLRRLRSQLDLVHVVGFDAPHADVVTVNAVRREELRHYFTNVEPAAMIRRRLWPVVRPQSLVVMALERALFRSPFPYCLPQSRAIGDDLMRQYGVPADAVEVLPAGVDTALFRHRPQGRDAIRRRFGLPPERPVALFVGDDFERKGLARAIEGIARAHVGAELWVAGGGDAAPYEKLGRALGVGGRVRFLGRVTQDELAEVFSGSDVVLLPSRQDAWGQVVIEALAAGRVVLVSEYAGAHEVIDDGLNGFVLERDGSPEQIAALLDLSSAPVRDAVGRRAVDTASHFELSRIYRRLREAHHRAYERRLRLEAGA